MDYATLFSVLHDLGTTERAIAVSLCKLALKGRRYSSVDCPINRYLRQHFQHQHFLVAPLQVRCFDPLTRTTTILTPTPEMERFLTMFDEGNYPLLTK